MPREPKGRSKPGQHAEPFFRSTYLMELARGSSFIASTLTPVTRRDAIAEVLHEFRLQHGVDKALLFRDLLAESLEKRGQSLAAQAVLMFEFQ